MLDDTAHQLLGQSFAVEDTIQGHHPTQNISAHNLVADLSLNLSLEPILGKILRPSPTA